MLRASLWGDAPNRDLSVFSTLPIGDDGDAVAAPNPTCQWVAFFPLLPSRFVVNREVDARMKSVRVLPTRQQRPDDSGYVRLHRATQIGKLSATRLQKKSNH